MDLLFEPATVAKQNARIFAGQRFSGAREPAVGNDHAAHTTVMQHCTQEFLNDAISK